MRVLCGKNWTKVMIELNKFRSQPGLFVEEEWDAVDGAHAYQWWSTFGTGLPALRSIAVELLARSPSASVCEFNWSAVGRTETKHRPLHSTRTNKLVNVASCYAVQQAMLNRQQDCIPSLDDVLISLLNDIEENAPLGVLDQVASEDNKDVNNSDSEEDEELDIVDDSELYQDWACNIK